VKAIVGRVRTACPCHDRGRGDGPGAPLLHDDLITRGSTPTRPASNVAKRHSHERGDVEAAFAEADLVIEREFTTRPVHQGYIEPHAVVADTGEDGGRWCGARRRAISSCGPHGEGARWEPSRLRVVPAEIGGGFGGKTTIYLEPLAVLLSAKAGRPVKLVMGPGRGLHGLGSGTGKPRAGEVGARQDGTLVAAEAWMAFEAGRSKDRRSEPHVRRRSPPTTFPTSRSKASTSS
jgi:CO/xanthine dehydrogenase Mo-binding subunit